MNKRQAFCYKGATLPSAVKRTAYPSELCVQMKSQKSCFHLPTKSAGATHYVVGKERTVKNGTISSRACTYRIVNKTRKSVCNIVIIIFFFLNKPIIIKCLDTETCFNSQPNESYLYRTNRPIFIFCNIF